MPAFFDKILRAGEGRILRDLSKIVDLVNAQEARISAMSDSELRGQTALFQDRYSKGETLDELMPEAFAVVREAAKRTLGQRHYDVQLMGGAALHKGNIAEMRTGEGKTLVATLPSYLILAVTETNHSDLQLFWTVASNHSSLTPFFLRFARLGQR